MSMNGSRPLWALMILQVLFLSYSEALNYFSSFTWNTPRNTPVAGRKTIALPPARAKELTSNPDIDIYAVLSIAQVIDPRTGKFCPAVDEQLIPPFLSWPFVSSKKKALIVIMPQLGDIDSMEYAELLNSVLPDLNKAQIELRIIGIGTAKTAHMFSLFTGIPLDNIRMDPAAAVHEALDLHKGPDWDVPSWVPEDFVLWFAEDVFKADTSKMPAKEVARAWLNYIAMCCGVSAPGTLKEIARGCFGDKSAPERVWPAQVVHAGPITIKGVSDWKIGQMTHKSMWKDEYGYQRPGELATVRLRSLTELATKFDDYVTDPRLIHWRGATFLLDASIHKGEDPLYQHRDNGVLSYSKTMDRPLSFLSNYIGMERARNPLGLNDPEFVYEEEYY